MASTTPARGFGRCSTARTRSARFLRATLGRTLVYAARVAAGIAHSIDDVDRAMRWGFGWELGPFETWDAIGLERVLEACQVADPPPLVRDALAQGAFRPSRQVEPTSTCPGCAGPATAARGQGAIGRRAEERRREPRRPRRRRARRRVPLEDERDRRRHDPDAAGRRQGGSGELPRARRRQRRAATSPPAPT